MPPRRKRQSKPSLTSSSSSSDQTRVKHLERELKELQAKHTSMVKDRNDKQRMVGVVQQQLARQQMVAQERQDSLIRSQELISNLTGLKKAQETAIKKYQALAEESSAEIKRQRSEFSSKIEYFQTAMSGVLQTRESESAQTERLQDLSSRVEALSTEGQRVSLQLSEKDKELDVARAQVSQLSDALSSARASLQQAHARLGEEQTRADSSERSATHANEQIKLASKSLTESNQLIRQLRDRNTSLSEIVMLQKDRQKEMEAVVTLAQERETARSRLMEAMRLRLAEYSRPADLTPKEEEHDEE
eukprot:gnl/Dysnectes_brevis/3173_a3963_1877.p1 GENE.gnl/Dysnectes_brevis/3173_a3963_1877~~gnl/Dysnectes_brevis/3173_a3963_1877.p1  ORF type:complete len:304 (+),score=23.22 gnl/Dysnectes_brevis/3173_a3963_1877:26-937(+)